MRFVFVVVAVSQNISELWKQESCSLETRIIGELIFVVVVFFFFRITNKQTSSFIGPKN